MEANVKKIPGKIDISMMQKKKVLLSKIFEAIFMAIFAAIF